MKFYLITKKVSAILVLLAFSTFGWTQGIVSVAKNVFVNTSFSETPSPGATQMSIYAAAKHGSVLVSNSSSFTYTPTQNYRGLDTFTVSYKFGTPAPLFYFRTYFVKIDNSFITVAQDYATTTKNTAVTIDVLANDNVVSTAANANISLDVTGISLLNNAASAIVNANNQVVFTPSAGFVGNAYVNYVVCDSYGFNCATGAVSVVVSDATLPTASFTRVNTSKNTAVVLLLQKSNFNISNNGKKGTATLINGNAFNYVPNTGFVGKDTVSFYHAGLAIGTKVEIEVINKAAINKFAMDDYAYTPKNQGVSVNVLSNDNALFPLVGGFTQPNPSQGTVTLANGKFQFTPTNNFKGIAKFTYLLNNSSAVPSGNPINEWATAYVVVSNQYPAKSVFNLSTPINTPLVLNYKVPITGYNFTIVDSTSHGALNYYAGNTTLNLPNQNAISGYNLVVYTPTSGFAGVEEFELLYCINGDCRTVKFIVEVQAVTPTLPTYCVGDCVWAGDANNDGIVDMADILPIGYCQGAAGLARSNASNNWFGQFGNNWNNPFMPAQDLKYIDTNGDGDVTATDTLALSNNFLKAHNIVAEKQQNFKATPFDLELLTPNPQIGDYVEVDLLLGKASDKVTDLYGFTMDFNLPTQVMNEQSLTCTFYNNAWLTHNSPTLRLSKKPMDGKLYVGYTRTNGTSASGFGKVAKLGFIIDDSLDGIRDNDGNYTVNITLQNGKTMGSDGIMYDVPEQTFSFPINTKKAKVAFEAAQVALSPNPTQDVLNVYINGGYEMNEYQIINLNGQTIARGKATGKGAQIDVRDLINGIYFVKVITNGGVVTKKFEVLK